LNKNLKAVLLLWKTRRTKVSIFINVPGRMHESVFIDDLQWNVDRAETVGIPSHTFTSLEALVGFLDGIDVSRLKEALR